MLQPKFFVAHRDMFVLLSQMLTAWREVLDTTPEVAQRLDTPLEDNGPVAALDEAFRQLERKWEHYTDQLVDQLESYGSISSQENPSDA